MPLADADVEAAYYLRPSIGCPLRFVAIGIGRESIGNQRELILPQLGGKEFFPARHGMCGTHHQHKLCCRASPSRWPGHAGCMWPDKADS